MRHHTVVSRLAIAPSFALLALLAACGGDTTAPIPGSTDSVVGTWTADVSRGPLASLTVEVHEAGDSFEGVASAMRRDCKATDQEPCQLTGRILAGTSRQTGSDVIIVASFPMSAIGAAFRGEAKLDGTMRGDLDMSNGTMDPPTRVSLTFHRSQ